MDKYLPVLIVGAIIGIFTIAFVIAYPFFGKRLIKLYYATNKLRNQLIYGSSWKIYKEACQYKEKEEGELPSSALSHFLP